MYSAHFRTIVVVDFEYEIVDGGLPNVLCMVAYVLDGNLQHMDTIRLWRGEFGSTPPFDTGSDTLIVGYSLWAEMTCFLTLGWRFPVHIYDLHTAYLATTNILLPYEPDEKRAKQRKNLATACCAYGIEGWEKIDKPGIAEAIGQGRWREYGREVAFEYCEEDVRNSAELLRRQLIGYCHYAPVDPRLVIRWSEYSAKSVARIQARGMPIDMALNTAQSCPIPNGAMPGRRMTIAPRNPTMMAVQRRSRTRSPRRRIAPSVPNTGARKLMAVTSPIGINARA